MTLSIIIVNFNVKYYVAQCLHSVFRAVGHLQTEVLVVDNCSTDGSLSYLKPMFPQVNFIDAGGNIGFSRANNLAISQARGKYILLLNPDTLLAEQTLERAVDWLEQQTDAGAVGVKMLKDNGLPAWESRRGIPTPMTAFYKMVGLGKCFPQSKRFGKYYMSYLPWNQPAAIEVVSGAFLLARKSALEQVGALDEDYFMYGEDIDLSYKLHTRGFVNHYIPEKILHYKGESTQKSSFKYVHVFYAAMLIFYRKHFRQSSFIWSFPIQMAIFLRASIAAAGIFFHRLGKTFGVHTLAKQPQKTFVAWVKAEHAQSLEAIFERHHIAARIHTLLPSKIEVSPIIPPRGKEHVFVVFDVSAFSYSYMLNYMEQAGCKNLHLAVYHPQWNQVITVEEVML